MSFSERFQVVVERSFIVRFLKGIYVPGLPHLSIYSFLILYVRGIIRGTLTLRAAAISWSLFISIFPFLLFVFTVLPYLPHYEELERIIFSKALPRFFPDEVVEYVTESIYKLAGRREPSLFNLTTLLAVFFATNGFSALLNGFYKTGRNVLRKMNFLKSYGKALIFTLSGTILVLITLLFAYYSTLYSVGLKIKGLLWLESYVTSGLIGLFFFALHFGYMVFLYFYGVKPKIKRNLKLVVPGALLTSALFFITLGLFRYYIQQFNNYQLLYGSIGIFLVVMLWVYINVIIVLIGFELNIAFTYASLGIRKSPEQEKFTLDEEDL